MLPAVVSTLWPVDGAGSVDGANGRAVHRPLENRRRQFSTTVHRPRLRGNRRPTRQAHTSARAYGSRGRRQRLRRPPLPQACRPGPEGPRERTRRSYRRGYTRSALRLCHSECNENPRNRHWDCNVTVAIAELQRVLKPGAAFFGVVAFLEPFHDNSYCHLTHLGTRSVLESAGFCVERLWPGTSLLQAFFDDLFGGWPVFLRPCLTLIGKSVDVVRAAGVTTRISVARLVGRRGPDPEAIRFAIAGSIGFIARKPHPVGCGRHV